MQTMQPDACAMDLPCQAQQGLEEDHVARAIAAALGKITVPKAAQNQPESAKRNSASDTSPSADDKLRGTWEGQQGTKRERPSPGDHAIAKRGRGDIDAQTDQGDISEGQNLDRQHNYTGAANAAGIAHVFIDLSSSPEKAGLKEMEDLEGTNAE